MNRHMTREDLWLPVSDAYDMSSTASADLDRFLNSPTLFLSKDYRTPDKSTYTYWENVLNNVSDTSGLFLELGVFSGTSINVLSEIMDSRKLSNDIYGFDCWTGLPEKWRKLEQGTFVVKDKPQVNNNAVLIDGLFCDSLPKFASAHPNKEISFLHMDADLYSSTMTAFEHLHDMFVPGTIIAFDEFALWPGFYGKKESEFEALLDASKKYGFRYEYIFRGWDAEEPTTLNCDSDRVSLVLSALQSLGNSSLNINTTTEQKFSAREKAVIKII